MPAIDSYIMRFNPDIQQRLMVIRRTALDVFGSVEEKLYYTLPAFCSNGKVIMFYGAYKKHISICVGNDWVDFLQYQYPQFQYTQFTILFQHNEPFPDDVVQVICDLLKPGIQSKCSR